MTTEVPAAQAAPVVVPVVPEVPVVEGETAAPELPKPERTFSQAEMDAAIEKRLAKERRKRQEIETRLKVTEDLALRGKQPETPAPKPADGEPKREQFETYEAFIEARADWKAEQKVENKFKERDQRTQDEKTKAEQEKAATEFRKKAKDAAKDIEDFDDVMAEATATPDLPVSRLAADPIQACDNPAKVLYHLAKNPEEAERIASLSVVGQAREIWKLEASLASAPAPKKPSSAPAPIAPVGGKQVAAGAEPDPTKDPKGWVNWRNQQVLAKRRG